MALNVLSGQKKLDHFHKSVTRVYDDTKKAIYTIKMFSTLSGIRQIMIIIIIIIMSYLYYSQVKTLNHNRLSRRTATRN